MKFIAIVGSILLSVALADKEVFKTQDAIVTDNDQAPYQNKQVPEVKEEIKVPEGSQKKKRKLPPPRTREQQPYPSNPQGQGQEQGSGQEKVQQLLVERVSSADNRNGYTDETSQRAERQNRRQEREKLYPPEPKGNTQDSPTILQSDKKIKRVGGKAKNNN